MMYTSISMIIENPAQIVQEFIQASVPLNNENDAVSALIEATLVGDTDSVEALLVNGADVNSRAKNDGRTALMMASMGDSFILQLLLDHGSDVNIADNAGNTALRYAIGWDAVECVKLLLDVGADKSVKDSQGLTLYEATERKGGAEILDLLKDLENQK